MLMSPEEMVATAKVGDVQVVEGVGKAEVVMRAADGFGLARGYLWQPAPGEPKGVVVICHGMVEHIDRYDHFARFLASNGYGVLGLDLPGHGESVLNRRDLGAIDVDHGGKEGAEQLINTLGAARLLAEVRWPDAPLFVLGHSMGSFVARAYAERGFEGLAGLVIMGTGVKDNALLATGRVMLGALIRTRGPEYRSPFMDFLGFSGFNRGFEGEGPQTGYEWLSRDPAVAKAFVEHPLDGEPFSVSSYWTLFDLITQAQDPARNALIPKDLPVLVISGAEDPVGDNGSGPALVADYYLQEGFEDVECVLFEGMRHEILNEFDREKVYDTLLQWFDAH